MAIVKQPPAIHTAFNPAMLNISGSEGSTIQILMGVGASVTRQREVFNGIAMFDLSKVVKSRFSDVQTYIVPDKIFIDNNLSFYYEVYETEVLVDPIPFTAINAVAQIGESSDLTKKRGTFLTAFDRLKKYPGYELTVSILGFDGNSFIRLDGSNIADTEITHACINIPDNTNKVSVATGGKFVALETNQAEVITNNDGDPIYIRFLDGSFIERTMYIDNQCLPSSPFYMRWINRQGGWDYWMFSFRQTVNRSIDNQLFFNPTIFDQEAANGSTKITNLDAQEKITVGASGLSEIEYECVSKLIYSPLKQWYSETLNKWIEIQLDEGETEKDTRVKSQQIELTFLLPDPQLQF